jgi:hypothetical protein
MPYKYNPFTKKLDNVSTTGPAMTVASTVEVVAETTDTTCFPVFVTSSSSGDYELKVEPSFTFNSDTSALSSLLFSASVITAGTSVEIGTDAATNVAGLIKMWGAGANNYYTTFSTVEQSANATYTLPTAMPGANSLLQSTSAGALSWVANTTFSVAAGSSSITTVGTINSGTWAGTAVAYDHGGTGLTAYPVKSIILPAASAALGTTTPATRETRELTTNKQVIDVLKFAHAGVCIAWWTFLLPDSYNGGVINAKITYMNVATDTTNNFLFSLSAGCITDGEPIDMALGTVQELETVVGDTAEDLKIGTWSTGVTPSGTPAGGKLLVLKLQRDPTDTAHDTTNLDAYVLGLRLEYTVNSWSD